MVADGGRASDEATGYREAKVANRLGIVLRRPRISVYTIVARTHKNLYAGSLGVSLVQGSVAVPKP